VLEDVESDLQVAIESGVGEIRAVSLPVIDGDRTQLRQLLQNIVANAINFRTPEVPPVTEITCRLWPSERVPATGTDHGQRVRIAVTNNGIGFEMKYAERIFGILQRLHNRAEYEGTGVGPATCHKLVERQNGALTVGSEPGIGTTFTIELPKT